ncbi:MAG TPA: DNA polymerase III subunit gamma and tau [Streptosporangiaceae bacterium]|nr:DNA polymerase III subunit gamma and tau [Streptosporangiaceae bacterium]
MAGDPSSTQQADGTAQSGGSLALYRRYRPATFAEVKGQEQVTEPLIRALKAGRISHAYLFSGPRGCGKTTSARILARSLNCVEGPTPEPCGVCDSCVALAPNGPGSIDVIEIDAASHGGVDDARDLRERAFYAPVSGRFKVYIIDEAHMVTREGFNALLKLVEEPPAHLKFVFATTEPEKVIPTIRSRTHHYPFRLVPPATLRQLLSDILAREGVSYEPEALQLVIRAGAGSVRDSLSVLDQLLAGAGESGLTYEKTAFLLGYTDASLLDEVTEAFAIPDGAAVFHVIDRVVEAGLDPRRFAADMLDRFRDLIVLSAVPDADKTGLIDAPADRLERMRAQADKFGQAELTRAAEVLSDGLVQMRGATAPRLLLELMCAQVLLPGASTGHSALLTRLERLERGAATAAPPAPPSPDTQGEPPRRAPEPPSRTPAPAPAPAQRTTQDTAQATPPPAPPTRSATPPSDAGALQRDWEAVLEAVKGVRRVAWILLRNANVQSLADGILTVRFPKEGDVKGFASSGCDADLKRVLADSFGLNVQVKAVSGADSGNGSGGFGDQDNRLTVPAQLQPQPSAPEPVPVKQARPVEPAPVPERADLDDGAPFDIDDPDASVGEAGITGMDLIKRELGGKIIDEIDNS